MRKAVFYHAGCPVCVAAENDLLNVLDTGKVDVEVVHLGEARHRLDEAESKGVRSVPALVLPEGQVLHINHGASMAEVRG